MKLAKILIVSAVFLALGAVALPAIFPVHASSKVGMHVLTPAEMKKTAELFSSVRDDKSDPLYITIPFTLEDAHRLKDWQAAFDIAKQENIVPLIRLSTRVNPEVQGWAIPKRQDILTLTKALSSLDWPQQERHVIVFNEPNHAGEWGGTLDPKSFAEMTEFTIDWLHTENANYVVMPAALDLAASNTASTKEALSYWRQALEHRPEIIAKIDAWNSHSYPNPGFMAAAQRSGQNSLRGYQNELAFLNHYTQRKLPIYITETGWLDRVSYSRLQANYDYAMRYIWSDEQIVAVTPFVLAGSPGPFAEFSFINEKGEPTNHWQALSQVIQRYQSQYLTQRPEALSF
jgi:hypothetical protein